MKGTISQELAKVFEKANKEKFRDELYHGMNPIDYMRAFANSKDFDGELFDKICKDFEVHPCDDEDFLFYCWNTFCVYNNEDASEVQSESYRIGWSMFWGLYLNILGTYDWEIFITLDADYDMDYEDSDDAVKVQYYYYRTPISNKKDYDDKEESIREYIREHGYTITFE